MNCAATTRRCSLQLTSYHNNQYYYYILYGLSENAIRYLVNYEDSVICGEPVSEYGTDYYSDVFDKGERFTIRTQDSYGNWINTVAPVYGEDGTVAAALEVGMDLGYQTAQRQESALNIILSVICSTVVVVMLLMEPLWRRNFAGDLQRRWNLSVWGFMTIFTSWAETASLPWTS